MIDATHLKAHRIGAILSKKGARRRLFALVQSKSLESNLELWNDPITRRTKTMAKGLPIIFATVLALGASATIARAQSQPSMGLTDLVDDPSRADLFELVVSAAKAQDEETSKSVPFNLYGQFVFPSDATFDMVLGKPRTNSIFGIDISHYTPSSLPMESLSQWHITFVYAKATQGTRFKDAKFSSFWRAMGQLGGSARVHRGAYHFLSSSPQESGLDQAKTFVSFLRENGGLAETDMPPVLDLEWDIAGKGAPDRWAGQNPDQIVAKVIEWLKYVESETHRRPMIYTAAAWWRSIKAEDRVAKLSGYKLWIADYSRTSRGVEMPTVPKGASAPLWQFTESARLAASFQGAVDANIYKNSDEDFYNDFAVARFK